MLLGVKTDNPVAELYLYNEQGVLVASETWQADRALAHGLLERLEQFLQKHEANFTTLKGLFIFRGPGSFTGLRIGATIVNTLAYALGVPVVGADGTAWAVTAVERLRAGEDERMVLPEYGAAPRITTPK